jgi:hypothetical protein
MAERTGPMSASVMDYIRTFGCVSPLQPGCNRLQPKRRPGPSRNYEKALLETCRDFIIIRILCTMFIRKRQIVEGAS